jgi:hypothetical protein
MMDAGEQKTIISRGDAGAQRRAFCNKNGIFVLLLCELCVSSEHSERARDKKTRSKTS